MFLRLRRILWLLVALSAVGLVWAKVRADQRRAVPAGHLERSIVVDGVERRFLLYVPERVAKMQPLPLVVMLHGMGGTARLSQQETGWSEKAMSEGFAVAYPEATRPYPSKAPSLGRNPQAWNDGSGRFHAAEQGVDDIAFIDALIDHLTQEFRIDANRVYVTGFSNGASMTFRLGAELAHRIAAIAPHSGTCWSETISPTRPLSVCYLTGLSDTLNPIDGGFPKLAWGGKEQGGKPKPPVMKMIRKWSRALECGDQPTNEDTQAGVHLQRFGPSEDRAEVQYLAIEGLGHHWAGGVRQAPEFLLGKSSDKLSATDIIWDFFAKHSIDAPTFHESSAKSGQ